MVRKTLRPYSIRFALAAMIAQPAFAQPQWETLSNGKDMSGWKTILDNAAPGEDPKGYVAIKDGAIHMYESTDPAEKVPFGVIIHEKNFSRYHLTFEYRWGGKKFAPRRDAIRDAGVIYHVTGPEKIWPDSVEYQIQEGDSGDIVFLPKAALTWMRPDPENAPEGQGDPGMLPEEGGFAKDFTGTDFAYIGRYPIHDTEQGWNRVDLIVQGSEAAEHVINGKTKARMMEIRKKDGSPSSEGKIALQLEGAEILYRDIKIRELGLPLRAEQRVVSLSQVKGQPSRKMKFHVTNPSKVEQPLALSLLGKDVESFTVTSEAETLAPGATASVTVAFNPFGSPGRHSAGIQIGTKEEGVFVILQGIHLSAFEGKNEPPLQSICAALGIPLNAGGDRLELDTRAATIGSSVQAPLFRAAGNAKIKLTPLARFSPPGKVPFGMIEQDSDEFQEAGLLADGSNEFPDAHQSIFPPLEGGKAHVEINAPSKPFSLYMKGHKYVSFTDPARESAAAIPHTARVYPVTSFQGKPMKHAWLVGFEEAENGDYQDAVFLLENADLLK